MASLSPTLTFADSYARLDWVEHLIGLVRPFVVRVEEQVSRGALVYETSSVGSFEYAQYRLEDAIEIPAELGFLVADIAINPRSCLDMAVQNIADKYAPSVPQAVIQFPIDDAVTSSSDRTRKLLAAMAAPLAELLEGLLPIYDTPEFGHFDAPINVTALMIREVSNANKHRNLTPTVRRSKMTGYSCGPGKCVDQGTNLDRNSPFPLTDATVLTVRYPTGTVSDTQLAALQVSPGLKLQITETQFRLQDIDLDLPIDANEFLDQVPKFVRQVLSALKAADEEVASPNGSFGFRATPFL